MALKLPPLIAPGTLPLRAAALTYYSFLAVVPLGGLSQAILESVGANGLAVEVRHFLFAQLGLGGLAASQVALLLSRADARLIDGLSGVVFLGSAIALVVNVEGALNEIFRVGKQRRFVERALRMLGLFVFGPPLLGGSLFLTAWWRRLQPEARGLPGFTLLVGPFGLILIAFFLLYRFGPNAPVPNWAAALGAAVAGSAWELCKWGYAAIAAHAYAHNALIYGPLAAIPVLLLWMQVSWFVVLGGARLTAAAAGRGP